ncbi:hypothetical protein [Thermococcus zilligii]|uniref:hypothetical protein n=1 Tax=Thermococcus zilligii TaxID=54076 RepID=UPI00029B0761|nr:hypothetical protein [Thermococcus zilligii]
MAVIYRPCHRAATGFLTRMVVQENSRHEKAPCFQRPAVQGPGGAAVDGYGKRRFALFIEGGYHVSVLPGSIFAFLETFRTLF